MRTRLKEINKGVELEDPVKPSNEDGSTKNSRREKMDEDVAEADEMPTKIISTPLNIDVKAAIKFVDFEGRVDADSLQKILTFVNPKRLVQFGLCHVVPNRCVALHKFLRRLWFMGHQRRRKLWQTT